MESVIKKDKLSYKELEGVLSIIDAMLDEGPVLGISNIEDPKEVLLNVLNHAIKHAPLSAKDCKIISNILDWQKENLGDAEIESISNKILETGEK